ncbi:cobalamin synthase [Candidatus Tenderia electrophaga]|uniref:Adenosylcobinamide-GDP ribazoletransferase n=1 Tax=Candidatus Tenderia electrophaga TaxID=1748243 RepID=A0A0S2TCJ4_9GAMM|nr:cobalamin synthase [Candidatus Tenderia electrophaga]
MLPPRPMFIALQFLTALPIRLEAAPANEAVGRSLLFYPLVGLLIGTLLAGLGWGLSSAPAFIAAALLLAAWVLSTGLLHLDGLADSADAWIGGLGDRDRTLAIMKDPRCGPAAVVILVLVLLLKFTALTQLIADANWALLLLAPLLGRTALLLLFFTTPYVRPGGLGSMLADHLPRRSAKIVLLITLTSVIAALGVAALWPLAAAGVTLVLARLFMLRRIGGTTGDTAGALVEITETVVLLSALLVQ